MKQKLVALIGAIAIIVVAFIGRGLLFDDDDGGPLNSSESDRLLCPADFREICEKIDGDLDIRFEDAGETADRLIKTEAQNELDGHAWIVPRAWAEMVIDTREFEDLEPLFSQSQPLASTGVVVTAWTGVTEALGCGQNVWSCLAEHVGQVIPDTSNRLQVGMPPIDSASGLPVAAAQAIGVLGAPTFNEDMLRQVVALGEGQQDGPLSRMRSRGPGGLTAATVLEAQATNLTSTFGTIVVPDGGSPNIRVDLVVVSANDEGLDSDVIDDIARAFTDAGWGPTRDGGDGLPDGDLLAVIWKEWPR